MQNRSEVIRNCKAYALILRCSLTVSSQPRFSDTVVNVGAIALMARDYDNFKENPAGISSILFYHATIIIHGEPYHLNTVDQR